MNNRKKIWILPLAAALVMALSAPVTAGATETAGITKGKFVTLSGGDDLGYTVRGRAVMVRFADSTLVLVQVRGLDPRETYPTHVHNAPCSASPPGGSHYQHDVGGAVDNVNEIWPTITTNRRGNGFALAWHDNRVRPDAMSIVVHYPVDTSIRLACADLS
jgi:hypothetical protein